MSSSSEKVFTKFVETKMRAWFKLNNLKRDGYIGKSDLKENADMFAKEYNLKDLPAKNLESWLVNGWNIVMLEGEKVAKSGNPCGLTRENAPSVFELNISLEKGQRISEDQYIAAFGEVLDVNKALFVEVFENMVGSFFDTFDTNEDGFIGSEDLIRGLNCFGIEQEEVIRMMFEAMDTDKTGLVNKSTYINHWVEFATGNNHDAPIAKFVLKIID